MGGNGLQPKVVIESEKFKEHQRAHRGIARSFINYPSPGQDNVAQVITALQEDLFGLIQRLLEQLQNVKMNIKVECLMARYIFQSDGTVDEETHAAYFYNDVPKELFDSTRIETAVLQCKDEITLKIVEFTQRGSGFRVKQVNSVEVKIFELRRFKNIKGNGYTPMPKPKRLHEKLK